MAQASVAVRNAMLDAAETATGASPILRLYDLTSSAPANCAASITATLVAEIQLPADWMAAASNGSKAMAGTWQDASANNAGTIDFFRIWDNAGTTCHHQGTVTLTGSGGDMTLDNTNVAAGQQVNITSFTWTAGNA